MSSFKGQFSWIQSMRQGGRKAISVSLTCTNLFQSETFDAAIIDGTGQLQPMVFTQLTLGAKKSLRFDMDTVGWDWCQGDTFAILDKNRQMDKHNKWTMNIKVPAPGECRDCHGTHKCKQCNGTGIVTNNYTHEVSSCNVCHGTGVCQACYVPFRNVATTSVNFQPNVMGGYGYNASSNVSSNQEAAKQRKIAALRQSIQELQAKIERADWDERMMKLRGTDISSRRVYISQVNLKLQYERQLCELQYRLQQMEKL